MAAVAINDAWQILGTGYLNGEQRGFLMTVIPDPTTLSLVCFGGVGLLVGPRRQPRQ